MFIHWGVYSQLARGEWVMQDQSIPIPSYEWLASSFNPVRFDTKEWVSLAKTAGVTLTLLRPLGPDEPDHVIVLTTRGDPPR